MASSCSLSLKHRGGNKLQFALGMLKSRWFIVVAAIWIQCCAGSSYNFGIYSESIKVALNYDQTHLDKLASFKDIGSNVGVLSGLLFDSVPPWAVLIVGALQSSIGYGMMWLSVTGRTSPPALWQMCLYMFLGANGSTYFNTTTIVTCVQNFPHSRGIIIGLLKGFLGLSAAILTQLYRAVYDDEPSSFLFMLMWLPSAMALLWMFIIRPVPEPKSSNTSSVNRTLYLFSALALALAAYLMTVIIVEDEVRLSQMVSVVVCAICGGILLLPLGVVFKAEREEAKLEASAYLTEPFLNDSAERIPFSVSAEEDNTEERKLVSSESDGEYDIPALPVEIASRGKPCRGQDHSFSEALEKADFWLLFVAMGCGMGSGLSTIDNMGQIGASLGYDDQKVATFISLWSIWNFLGRLGFGTISEIFLRRYGVGRPMFLVLTQATMCVGHLMVAIAFPGALYVGSVIIGLSYGAQWSLMPAITSEIFGLLRFGTLFNTITIASPMAAYYLSVQVAGHLYDYEANEEKNAAPRARLNSAVLGRFFLKSGSGDLECYGPKCFRLTFMVMATATFFGCLVCLILVARTRRFYTRIAARLESERVETQSDNEVRPGSSSA